jgi:hypothetical protein
MNDTGAAIVLMFFSFGSLGHFLAVRSPSAVNIPAILRSSGAPMPSQTPANPNAADGAQLEPETTNFVYYVNPKDGSHIPLEPETPETSASSNILTGAVKGHMIVQGQKSSVRLKLNEKAEFEVRPAYPSQYFGLRFERFEVKDGTRFLRFVKNPKPSNSADRPGLLAFDTSHFGKSSIKLSVPYELSPGEYGITVSTRGTGLKVYCFGVDPP